MTYSSLEQWCVSSVNVIFQCCRFYYFLEKVCAWSMEYMYEMLSDDDDSDDDFSMVNIEWPFAALFIY